VLRIGVISDTHGLLRPEVEQRLAGVTHIVHVATSVRRTLSLDSNGLRLSLRSEGTSIPATGRSNTRVTMLYAWRTSDARPNLIGRLTPLARRVSTHTASSSTAITHSASRALRHVGDARQTAGRKYLYAPLQRLDFLASVLHLLVVFCSMDLTREWRWTRNEKSLVPPMTSVARPANSADCSSSDIATSSRCFVHSLSVRPVARGKATMLGFGMRREIIRSQRSSEAARCFCRSCAGARR
jgi:hypothetical protein